MSNVEPLKMSRSQREEYSKRVKTLRQAADMKQEELAELAEVSRQTISSIENGKSVPQQDVLIRILQLLGVDLEATRFEPQTELWLSMMGTLIEAVPTTRRAPTVDKAIRTLADGIKGGDEGTGDGGTVTPIRPLPTNDGGYLDDAVQGLDTAAGTDETQAEDD